MIVSYLFFLRNMNKSYSVINTHKAVILETVKLLDSSYSNRNFTLISRFMKGLHNTVPPKPRYTSTWNVATVLGVLALWMPLDSLTLKKLTYKLVALLALGTAARAQTLKALRVDQCVFNYNSVVFNCGSKLKSSKPGTDFFLTLKMYKDQELCPVRTLKTYIAKTRSLRKDNQLFISYVNYKSVSTSTLARWLKSVLVLAGIDTNIFKAHSYRGASSSAAMKAGCKLSDILKMADWTSMKNFHRFYLRDVQSNTITNNRFSDYVLGTKKT